MRLYCTWWLLSEVITVWNCQRSNFRITPHSRPSSFLLKSIKLTIRQMELHFIWCVVGFINFKAVSQHCDYLCSTFLSCVFIRLIWQWWLRIRAICDLSLNMLGVCRVNVGCGPAEERVLLTGLHAVADIYCECCKTTLGWKYVSHSL